MHPSSRQHQQHNHEHPNNNRSNEWTRFEDLDFEEALVIFPEGTPQRWERVASHVLGRSLEEVKEHYEALLHDVHMIESGLVELPNYLDDLVLEPTTKDNDSPKRAPSIRSKKGTPWTREEQRLFLMGLKQYGRGDWRSISRNVVVSRTPTQVASHAQKYFIRQSATTNRRKRTSIHDITLGDNDLIPHLIDGQNGVHHPNGPMHQLQAMQQTQEIHQLNPPNNMPHQMSGFVHNNGL